MEEVRIWIGRFAQQSADGIYYVGTVAFAAKDGVGDAVNVKTAEIMKFVEAYGLNIMNPKLICGLLIGCMMAFVFCAMSIKAVGRAAGAMVEEVRRQFREIAGIMEGTGKPDYARCVSISTKGAQREMILPSLLAIIIPVLTGLFLGVAGVMGLLAGGLSCGFVLAITLNNSGGAWDNAKKYIEKGDPFKDTAGPSLNILIKLMAMVSVVFSGVIVKFGPQISEMLGLGGK